jgi:hypothetical protein
MNSFINCRTTGRRLAFWLVFLTIVFSQAFCLATSAGRLLPNGPVTLYQEDKAIGVYTREAPLPENVYMLSEERCAVQLYDLYLVAEALTRFAVDTSEWPAKSLGQRGGHFFQNR